MVQIGKQHRFRSNNITIIFMNYDMISTMYINNLVCKYLGQEVEKKWKTLWITSIRLSMLKRVDLQGAQ